MMHKLTTRQRNIINLLYNNEYILVKDLAARLDVSLVTIRKELSFLQEKGYVFRTFGGAVLQNRYAFERDVKEKETLYVAEKKRIAIEAEKKNRE